MMREAAVLGACLLVLGAFVSPASATSSDCVIFVHGTAKDSGSANWLNDPNGPYSQWGSTVSTIAATGTRRYVVHYNAHREWWNAAGEVATQINHALSGGSDGSGGSCSGASTYYVLAYSMGGPVMDFILGNASSNDPYYNFNGDFARIRSRIAAVYTVSGAHRGTEYADAACGGGGGGHCVIAGLFASCDNARQWLNTSNSYRVESYSNSPGRAVYLIAGGSDGNDGWCLADPHDDAVAYTSSFACNGSPTSDWSRSNQCTGHQESSNFFNVDQSRESHETVASGADSSAHRMVATGSPFFSGSAGSTHSYQSTARMLAGFL